VAAPAAKEPVAAAPAAKPPAAKSGTTTRVVVGITETIESHNPYAHLDSLKSGLWCEVYGCLISYDFEKSNYVGVLAESWKVENPTTWVFNLHKNIKWSDGSPLTSADILHSFDRLASDPSSLQKSAVGPIAKVEAVDEQTIRITTKAPNSLLLDFIKERAVTNKALFDKHGDDAYKLSPISTGPYMLKELVPDQHVTIVKNPNWWRGQVQGPDEVVYRVLREAEVRVTALLNNEIQIAQFVPPHMAERVSNHSGSKIEPFVAIEMMFLAMRPDTKPWDNKLVRQAVAYAIDRDAIIKSLLQGYAEPLDGPVGPGQIGYDPNLQPKYTYNPQKAKELLAQAGYPNGVDVELSSPVNRYTQDKQISEAVAKMLTDVGIRTRVLTPEWPSLWANVQAGKVPFYYMGRGALFDVGRLDQYFEGGVAPHLGYSNPQVNELFKKQRAEFDREPRQKILTEMMSLITDDAPAHFMWRHKLLMGMSRNVEHKPRPDDRVFANDIRLK
jgi:peptide/nickel transport system substrate-binding protein